MSNIVQNLQRVRDNIATTCRRCGRDSSEVRLVAVTKTVGEAEIRELYRLGVRDFGENRVEVLLPKLEQLSDLEGVRWHFIGHLQRNKAKKVLAQVAAIHSVESAGLLSIIAGSEYIPEVFIEVSISGEENKYGLAPKLVPELIAEYKSKVKLVGMMTMAPFEVAEAEVRGVFAGLRELRDEMAARFELELPYLSMGMSNDYIVAIEEGATHIRVGSELFR